VLRFLALICTAVATGLALIAQRIAGGDVPVLSSLFSAVLPGEIHSRVVGVIVVGVLQSVCYAVCHFYLKRLYRYAAGDTEAAPHTLAGVAPRSKPAQPSQPTRWRLRRPTEGPVWSACQRLFATPTGRWLAPFAIPMSIIVFFASPLAFTGHVHATVYGLSVLYARTLMNVMRNPDTPEPLLEPERAGGSA
jgi:ribose/xylose/arabinose/galactoside ABC-type transport system permease subunit